MVEIEVLLKKVYGHDRFYPKNENAHIVCELMCSKTFTKDQLVFCKSKGWNIKVVTEEYVI